MRAEQIQHTRRPSYYNIPHVDRFKVSIEDVAENYFDYGQKLYDVDWNKGEKHIVVPTMILDKHKEWNRYRNNPNSHNTPEEWDELKADIERNGITTPVHITLYKKSRKILMTEGNHRLAIAKELGIRLIPVVFFFH